MGQPVKVLLISCLLIGLCVTPLSWLCSTMLCIALFLCHFDFQILCAWKWESRPLSIPRSQFYPIEIDHLELKSLLLGQLSFWRAPTFCC
uniref:Uncharacterized protein n=1 Tax=Rhizophora mucronata TaxID=61149 RepID=A0A2P2P6C3_RHIMU